MEVQNEIQLFFQSIETDFVPPEKSFDLICTNVHSNFRTKSLSILRNEEEEQYRYCGHITYRILHCESDSTMIYKMDQSFTSISDLMNHFYFILWNYTLCSECFYLVSDHSTNVSTTLCAECYPSRIMHHWGILHNKSESTPTCSICLEQVYHSKLQCGHYVHKTCFIKMNSKNWFEYDTDIRCPICRKYITDQDKIDFFLYYHYTS